MKCPYCGDNTKDAWKQLIVEPPSYELLASFTSAFSIADVSDKQLKAPDGHVVTLDWMYCEADELIDPGFHGGSVFRL
jgi:hypothetical protein